MKKRRKKEKVENLNNYIKVFLMFMFFVLSIEQVYSESAYGEPIKNEFYEISRSEVIREISRKEILPESITITNLRESPIKINVIPTEGINEFLIFENPTLTISALNSSDIKFLIVGKEPKKIFGEIDITGDIEEKIKVNITINNNTQFKTFFVDIIPSEKTFHIGETIEAELHVQKTNSQNLNNVTLKYYFFEKNSNQSNLLQTENLNIEGSSIERKQFQIAENISEGQYIIMVEADYLNETVSSYSEIAITRPFLQTEIFGLFKMWHLIAALSFILFIFLIVIFIRRRIEKNKKYKMQLYLNTLPKKGERTIYLGKIAELNKDTYYDLDNLTVHSVVAGATGGGKSISAQVLIEEVLMKNIAVIVFDPTAQWSGMLRKCDDKKMISFYPKFGLKPTDARAFPGSVRQVKNARQVIDIKKHMTPGHIQIFTLNKLDPSEMDVFVASVIASIFRSGPEEYPGLRVMLVFDEVHRLLPKFGGSGKGFLQIERACREFRKWGFGVMLVSQVLSDFVGEIKANINTEVQMRTRDESDLNRIKTKYGEEFLQSLIKASVGVGMFVNPKYNKGKPYFVAFRPILHNTRRLSDEILDKYNDYNDAIDDIEYQIEQLESFKVDVFDLKMEIKLVKDKLMTGNFSVVDIYLEGLKPRLEKQWQKIGKKPKKKELELVDTSAIESSIAEASKGRDNWNKNEKEAKPAS